MNLGQLIGEQQLRISALEDALDGQGIVVPEDRQVEDLQRQLVQAHAAREEAAAVHHAEVARLSGNLATLRQRLDQDALRIRLQQEIDGRAADQAAYAARLAALNRELDRLRQAPAPQPAAESSPAPQSTPQRAVIRGQGAHGPQPYRDGTKGFLVLSAMRCKTVPVEMPAICRDTGLDRNNVSWILRDMSCRGIVTRSGTRRHYRYLLNPEYRL